MSSIHTAEIRGKIMFGKPDGTPFNKEDVLLMRNDRSAEIPVENSELNALQEVETKADMQTRQNLGLNATMLEEIARKNERKMQIEALANDKDMTQDELEELYAKNGF